MGVDATIFAKKAKKAMWFHRLKFFRTWFDEHEDDHKFQELMEKIDEGEDLSASDIEYVLDKNKKYQTGEVEKLWCSKINTFVTKLAPDDTYFVLNDSFGKYPAHVIADDGYEELDKDKVEPVWSNK